MARVPMLRRADLPEEYQYLLDEEAMGEINLLRSMVHNPAVLQSYMRYGSTLWSACGLDPSDLELAILTVARTLDARYEWQQHVPIARDRGVPDADILAIGRERFDHFSGERYAMVEYVRAVVRGTVTDGAFDRLAEHVGADTAVGVTLLAAHYLATARYLDALAVPLEDDFVGWDLDGSSGGRVG